LTTQAGAKIVPALRGVSEKAPLMSTDGLYAGAPGRCAPVCVARYLFRITTKTSGQQCSRHCFCIHSIHGDKRFWAQAPMGWDTWMYLTKGVPRTLIDAFSAHNRGGDER